MENQSKTGSLEELKALLEEQMARELARETEGLFSTAESLVPDPKLMEQLEEALKNIR